MSNIVRIVLSSFLLIGTVALFWFGHWGWGILGIFMTILAWVTVFFNENMLIAQWYLRKENMVKAEQWLQNIKSYEKQLISAQHEDRKSVVKGKSEDYGGRRSVRKKREVMKT